MTTIAITDTRPSDNEARRIAMALANGWTRVHIRYPGLPAEATEKVLAQLTPEQRGRVTLHDHFHLAERGLASGVHLNSRNPLAPEAFDGIISRSCHTIAEAIQCCTHCDYVTLSPVFESVSKPGYGAASSLLAEFSKLNCAPECSKIVALGGITPQNVATAIQAGFGGVAVLGSLFGIRNHEAFAGRIHDFGKAINEQKT